MPGSVQYYRKKHKAIHKSNIQCLIGLTVFCYTICKNFALPCFDKAMKTNNKATHSMYKISLDFDSIKCD